MTQNLTKRQRRQLKLMQQGWDDFHARKSILSFPGNGADERANYEVGWKGARAGLSRPGDKNHEK